HDQRQGRKSSVARPGLNEPHFISPFSMKTHAEQLGIAGWTSTNPNVPPGHTLSGDRAGSLGFGVAAEWGARPRSERPLIRWHPSVSTLADRNGERSRPEDRHR